MEEDDNIRDEEFNEDELDNQEEVGGESELSKLLKKLPDWSVGLIIYNKNAYPIARSRYAEGEFYFSTSWRSIAKNVNGDNVVMTKDGDVKKYKVKRKGDSKYIQVTLI
ncbi:MAG: hypothetical protein ACP5NY_06785 [Thermocladium sp.]